MSSLSSSLQGLKSKINNFEEEFEAKIKEVEEKEKEEKRKEVKQNALDDIIHKKDPVITINIGGKLFKCSYSVLTSVKDSLFEKIYENQERVNEVLFYDRSYNIFHIILNFLRTKTFNPKDYIRKELEELKFESDYYAISPLTTLIDEILTKVEIVGMVASAKYSSCGNHKFEDLNSRDLSTGVCVQSPYTITLELNSEHEFEKLEVGGWTGNSSSWASSNGSNAQVLTSTDNITYKEVGRIPGNFGSTIITFNVKKSVAKYIRFQHNGYLGLGFVGIVKDK